ncbi:hypothetical protein HYH03_003702 [Edaphochlamys debaryana]|uniref:Uncharacterized protein n=1 Tax=Edaphochlamys debaryana TaxID=47281 RepID=A0A836C362_9CHLO|nr:hypothetical protein HYH03_003702 [Edaphochlamys debaryana]|eukprot:KAG2498445.1 hypothetical protein HYH03_003702 [Edaphochlamys debaryana]
MAEPLIHATSNAFYPTQNTFHSALRSKAAVEPGGQPGLLRSYAQAVGPNCADETLRRRAYVAARQRVAAADAAADASDGDGRTATADEAAVERRGKRAAAAFAGDSLTDEGLWDGASGDEQQLGGHVGGASPRGGECLGHAVAAEPIAAVTGGTEHVGAMRAYGNSGGKAGGGRDPLDPHWRAAPAAVLDSGDAGAQGSASVGAYDGVPGSVPQAAAGSADEARRFALLLDARGSGHGDESRGHPAASSSFGSLSVARQASQPAAAAAAAAGPQPDPLEQLFDMLDKADLRMYDEPSYDMHTSHMKRPPSPCRGNVRTAGRHQVPPLLLSSMPEVPSSPWTAAAGAKAAVAAAGAAAAQSLSTAPAATALAAGRATTAGGRALSAPLKSWQQPGPPEAFEAIPPPFASDAGSGGAGAAAGCSVSQDVAPTAPPAVTRHGAWQGGGPSSWGLLATWPEQGTASAADGGSFSWTLASPGHDAPSSLLDTWPRRHTSSGLVAERGAAPRPAPRPVVGVLGFSSVLQATAYALPGTRSEMQLPPGVGPSAAVQQLFRHARDAPPAGAPEPTPPQRTQLPLPRPAAPPVLYLAPEAEAWGWTPRNFGATTNINAAPSGAVHAATIGPRMPGVTSGQFPRFAPAWQPAVPPVPPPVFMPAPPLAPPVPLVAPALPGQAYNPAAGSSLSEGALEDPPSFEALMGLLC